MKLNGTQSFFTILIFCVTTLGHTFFWSGKIEKSVEGLSNNIDHLTKVVEDNRKEAKQDVKDLRTEFKHA